MNDHPDDNGKNTEDKKDNVVNFAEMRRKEKDRQAQEPSNQRHASSHPPMINLPPMTKWLLVANIGIYVAFFFLSRDVEIWTLVNLGFIPARFAGFIPFDSIWNYASPVAHMFLHSGGLHIAMNVTMLAAFGAGVEKAFGPRKFIIFYILCGLIGAAGHSLLDPSSTAPVVGASGAISGLFAAILIVLQRAGSLGQGKYGLWPFIALWCGISFLFAAVGGGVNMGDIAWAAHLGGFFGGFLLMRHSYFKI